MNDKFYEGLEREHALETHRAHIWAQFHEYCVQNEYRVQYATQSLRGQYQCTVKISSGEDVVEYHMRGGIHKSEENALFSVVSCIVNAATRISRPGRSMPPFDEVSGAKVELTKVEHSFL